MCQADCYLFRFLKALPWPLITKNVGVSVFVLVTMMLSRWKTFLSHFNFQISLVSNVACTAGGRGGEGWGNSCIFLHCSGLICPDGGPGPLQKGFLGHALSSLALYRPDNCSGLPGFSLSRVLHLTALSFF